MTVRTFCAAADHIKVEEMAQPPRACSQCVSCGSPLAEKLPAVNASVYTLGGMLTVQRVRMRCTSAIHYYNFRWIGGGKRNSLHVEDCDYIFITAHTGFDAKFPRCHDALQFRGFLSVRAVEWAQRDCAWELEHEHVRFRLHYGAARLLFLQETSSMLVTLPWRERHARILSIRVDNQLQADWLKEYDRWWHEVAVPDMIEHDVKAVAMDGHEKIATRCYDAPPSRGGRPRSDGKVKLAHNGWFTVTEPASGCVLGIVEMREGINRRIRLPIVRPVQRHSL